MRSAKVPVYPLLHVAALLRRDDHHLVAMESGHAADDGGIVAKSAISMNLAEIGEDAFDVIKRLRALRVARQFRLLPGGGWGVHFQAKGLNAFLQGGNLTASGVIGACRLHLGDLAFDLLQFLLCFFGGCHALSQLMMRTLPRPHNCSTRAMKVRSGSTL